LVSHTGTSKKFQGSSNVKISSDLHSKTFKLAYLQGKSLNQLVEEAIEKEVTSLAS